MRVSIRRFVLLALVVSVPIVVSGVLAAHSKHSKHSFHFGPFGPQDITLERLGSYSTGVFDGGAAEIVAHDPKTQRLFVVNADAAAVDVLDISNPAAPTLDFQISLLPFGSQANSVAIHKNIVALAVQAPTKTDNGKAVFFTTDGQFLSAVEVGALPDMLTFTPDGKRVLVANEGEPNDDYSIDPVGSVSLITLKHKIANLTQADVVTIDFSAFNNAPLPASIRIFGPGATVAQDLEPEYIAVAHDSKTAWATLQENNAIAEIDLEKKKVKRLVGLGFKNHSLAGNGLDPSDRDGPGNTPAITIGNWPVLGMYQPDAIVTLRSGGETYLVMANEGDAREWDPGLIEEARINSLDLDNTRFPNEAALKSNAALGRLGVSSQTGDLDHDGDIDTLFAFGGRSFSIRKPNGSLVFDSGAALEQITAAALPAFFNSNNDSNGSFDSRSDNKGPEPEGLTLGKILGRDFLFVGLERIGGIVIYDVTDPKKPRFVSYFNDRDFSGDAEAGTAGDLGPEGLIFIDASESPIHRPLLVAAHEVSGTTTIFQIVREP